MVRGITVRTRRHNEESVRIDYFLPVFSNSYVCNIYFSSGGDLLVAGSSVHNEMYF